MYDITGHIVEHPGWDYGGSVSTVLSILAHLGSECTAEFTDIHRPYPIAWRQLSAYYIGELDKGGAAAAAAAAAAVPVTAGLTPAAADRD